MTLPSRGDDGRGLLRQVLGALGGAGGEYALLRKQGRILCAVPRDRETALRTLGLYSPQRVPARMASLAWGLVLRAGLGGTVLPTLKVDGEPAGSPPTGVLLGSPAHPVPRAVAVRFVGGDWEVAKLAFGEAGHAILAAEAAMLEGLDPSTSHAPAFRGFQSAGDAAVLRMRWEGGRPMREPGLEPVLPILRSWLLEGEDPHRPLGEFDEWPVVDEGLREGGVGEDRIASIAATRVRRAIRHGDFVRWNLRRGAGGAIRIHDWERGSLAGPAGFDLVHYLVQEALLIDRMPPRDLLASVRRRLDEGGALELLRDSGWAGDIEGLMLAVFAFTTAAGYEDQRALLRRALEEGF